MDVEEVTMNTILVPLDGSVLAERVLPYVRRLASILDAQVCLLQVLQDVGSNDMFNEVLLGAYGLVEPPEALRDRQHQAWEAARQRAEGYLDAQAAPLREAGLDVQTELLFGSPDQIIVEVARERHVTLIAMATHGYSGLRHWTLGSVTDRVVHTATTPVFVVGSAGPAPAAPDIKRILVPLDGSAFAQQALPLATDLATRAHAELLLLEAVAPLIGMYPDTHIPNRPQTYHTETLAALESRAAQELDRLAGELRQQGITATAVTELGYPAEVIVDEAGRRAVDLIVMATHGYSGLRRWALGSVAHKVLHSSTTPLLLVRAQAIEEEMVAGSGTNSEGAASAQLRP
jgi:nucleotide-binding universal stress UspA family protein